MADTTIKQLEALTQIRRLIKKHFPDILEIAFFCSIEEELIDQIELAHDRDQVVYDPDRGAYIIWTNPECKVCHTTSGSLTLIAAQSKDFFLCPECMDEIIKAARTPEKG